MAGAARSKSDFPPLRSPEFSQTAVDQQALAAIKKIWDKHAKKWPDEFRQTILRLLKVVKQTPSNHKAPSSHKVWKDTPWNFGHWVVMNGIYDSEKLSNMKNQLRDKYTGVDFDKMDGPGLPDEESDDDDNLPSSVNTKSSKSLKLRKRTMTNSPGHSSSRADDEEETSQKGGTLLPPLKRSARLDKRRRNAVDEDSGDETSAVGIKRGRSITIKKEPEIDDVGEQQPSSYRRQTPQVLQDFRLPGVPAAEGYSTRHAGIDPRYNLMGGDPRVSNGYLPTSDYRMGGDPRASNGYLPTTRDLRSPYPERDLGQRGRPSTIDVPINEEIEPAAIVRLRQEMNTRLQSQEQCHFDEIRTVREEMRAMRTEFEQKLFDYKQEHEKSIMELANAASLAGHDNK